MSSGVKSFFEDREALKQKKKERRATKILDDLKQINQQETDGDLSGPNSSPIRIKRLSSARVSQKNANEKQNVSNILSKKVPNLVFNLNESLPGSVKVKHKDAVISVGNLSDSSKHESS